MEKWLNIAILKHFASFPPIKFRTFSLSPHSPASGNISRPASSGEGLTSHSRYKKHRMASGAGDHTGAQTPQSAAKLHPPHGCLPSSDPRATLKMEATLQGGCHVPLSPTGDILPLKARGKGVAQGTEIAHNVSLLANLFPPSQTWPKCFLSCWTWLGLSAKCAQSARFLKGQYGDRALPAQILRDLYLCTTLLP